MAVAAGISALGAIQQGQARKQEADARAVQTLNEGLYRQDAAQAQAEKIRKAGRAQRGEAKAALAASGVKLGEGTPLEIDKTISTNVEEDALSAILSGKRAMSSATQEASLLQTAGDNAVTNSYFNAAGSVLGAARDYYKGNWRTTAGGGTNKLGYAPGAFPQE
jgi:hypothetical protein